MKKIISFGLLIASLFMSVLSAKTQVTSYVVDVSTFAKDPQLGSYNYFGVKVTLNQTYEQDITVTGFIWDKGGSPNDNHPYSLTVTAGNLTEQTSSTFYETSSTVSSADFRIATIAPLFITKDDSIYASNGKRGSFTEDFRALSIQYSDSTQAAIDFLVGINPTSPLNQEQRDEFITSLDDNGVAYTASAFNLDSNDVALFDHKLDTAISIFKNAAQNLYGSVDSITRDQVSDLIYRIGLANVYSRSTQGGGNNFATPCVGLYFICVTGAAGIFEGEVIGCRFWYLFNYGRRQACYDNAELHFIQAATFCHNGYVTCQAAF